MTSEQQEITIDLPKLFNLSANLLVASFQRQSEENLKRLFKELKQGGRVDAGKITAEQSGAVIPVQLQLERSAYKGQFNLPHFSAAIDMLLQKLAGEVRKDPQLRELRTLSSPDNREIVFNIPAGIKIGTELNVLMLSVLPCEDSLVVRLLFVDGEQFEGQD